MSTSACRDQATTPASGNPDERVQVLLGALGTTVHDSYLTGRRQAVRRDPSLLDGLNTAFKACGQP